MINLPPFIRKQFWSSIYFVAFWFCYFTAIKVFQLNIFQSLSLYYVITLIRSAWIAKGLPNLMQWFKSCLIFTAIMSIVVWLYQFGYWGYTTVTVLMLVWFFSTRWKAYWEAIENIQASIWGKPLKEFTKEEWNNRPRHKFVWRKTKVN
jgi:hypothetical protein